LPKGFVGPLRALPPDDADRGASGSVVARFLRVGERERRILYVAGIAAGVSAVFRTPLGAALFATEVLYRDDFEADARRLTPDG
jgi:H+/Cl- antiporter ClcA